MERWEEYAQFFQKVVFSKTEDEYKDLLKEFKTEFNWNNGNLHIPSAFSTPEKSLLQKTLNGKLLTTPLANG
jgi:hypothetical protein